MSGEALSFRRGGPTKAEWDERQVRRLAEDEYEFHERQHAPVGGQILYVAVWHEHNWHAPSGYVWHHPTYWNSDDPRTEQEFRRNAEYATFDWVI